METIVINSVAPVNTQIVTNGMVTANMGVPMAGTDRNATRVYSFYHFVSYTKECTPLRSQTYLELNFLTQNFGLYDCSKDFDLDKMVKDDDDE